MTHFITTQITQHGYLAVFLLMVLESACIPVPSEAVMPFGGALAAGLFVTHHQAHVSWIIIGLVGASGNLIGALIAYAVGRYGGRPFIERWGRFVALRPHHLDRAHRFFDRRGDSAVLLGRVLPVIRTFISLPAGAAEMRILPFSALTLLGSLPWTLGLAYAGYALAGNWRTVGTYVTAAAVVIAVAAIAVIVRWLIRERRRPGHDGVEPEPATGRLP